MLATGLQALFTDTFLTVAGMLVFVTVFTLVTIRVLTRRKDAYDIPARLPLEEEFQ